MSSNIFFLSRNGHAPGPVPLWHPRDTYHGNDQEYFDIEIYSDENYVEKDFQNDDILNKITFKCHICNLDVPKTFIEEHIKSVKHEICEKIANLALERAQLHLKSNFIPPGRTIRVADTHFCDQCTVVVLNVDKDKHILSNKHQRAVKNDELLQKLVKIYEDPDKSCDTDIPSEKDIELHNLVTDFLQTEARVEDSIENKANGGKGNVDETEDKDVKTDVSIENKANGGKGNVDETEDKDVKTDVNNVNENCRDMTVIEIQKQSHIQNNTSRHASKLKNSNDVIPKKQHEKQNVEVQYISQAVTTDKENNTTILDNIQQEKQSHALESTSNIKKELNTEVINLKTENKTIETAKTKNTEKEPNAIEFKSKTEMKTIETAKTIKNKNESSDKETTSYSEASDIPSVKDIELHNLVTDFLQTEARVEDSIENKANGGKGNVDETEDKDVKTDVSIENKANGGKGNVDETEDKDVKTDVNNVNEICRDMTVVDINQKQSQIQNNTSRHASKLKNSNDVIPKKQHEKQNVEVQYISQAVTTDNENNTTILDNIQQEKQSRALESTSNIKKELNTEVINLKTENKTFETAKTKNTEKEPNAIEFKSKTEMKTIETAKTIKNKNESSAKETTSYSEAKTTKTASMAKIEKEYIESSKTDNTSNDETECAKENKSNYTENMKDIQRYLEIALMLNTSTINVTACSKDAVYVTAPNVEKVRIPLANFHGFSVTGDYVVCNICLTTSMSVNGKNHKWCDEHMKKVMSPLNEGYFRQVTKDSMAHCILCNSLHSNAQISVHNASEEHASRLQKYTVFKQVSSKTSRVAIANCIYWTPEKMFCRICDIDVPKTNESVNDHVHTAEHVTNRALLVKVNQMVPLERDCHLCVVCQKKIWPGQLMAHCKNSQHKKRIA